MKIPDTHTQRRSGKAKRSHKRDWTHPNLYPIPHLFRSVGKYILTLRHITPPFPNILLRRLTAWPQVNSITWPRVRVSIRQWLNPRRPDLTRCGRWILTEVTGFVRRKCTACRADRGGRNHRVMWRYNNGGGSFTAISTTPTFSCQDNSALHSCQHNSALHSCQHNSALQRSAQIRSSSKFVSFKILKYAHFQFPLS
jgi:hypothetical protein